LAGRLAVISFGDQVMAQGYWLTIRGYCLRVQAVNEPLKVVKEPLKAVKEPLKAASSKQVKLMNRFPVRLDFYQGRE